MAWKKICSLRFFQGHIEEDLEKLSNFRIQLRKFDIYHNILLNTQTIRHTYVHHDGV